MRGRTFIAAVVAILAGSAVACADMAGPADLPRPSCGGRQQDQAAQPAPASRIAGPEALLPPAAQTAAGALPLCVPEAPEAGVPAARALEGGPGSASLFFVALGALGAWQVGRSLRKVHYGLAPDWYHTGGPAQVGRASPIDLSAPAAAAPAYSNPLPEHLNRLGLQAGESRGPVGPQFLPAALAPRAPPLPS